MRTLGTTLLGIPADPAYAPPTTLDTVTGDLLTWQRFATEEGYRLARIDVSTPSVSQSIEVPGPLGDRDVGSAIVQMGADAVWNNRPAGHTIYRSNLDGTPTDTPWLDVQPEITTYSLSFRRIYNLDVDTLGRLYAWMLGSTTDMVILRYLQDGSFDRIFRLQASLNGSSPSSHDAYPTGSSSAQGRWPRPVGMQVAPDGASAFVTMNRVLGAGDASLQKQSIYKFDLAGADAGTGVAPATVFAQIDASQSGYSPAGGGGTVTQYTIGQERDIGSYVGLAVSSDGTVAVQVATRTTRLVTVGLTNTWIDDAQYWLYLYDPDGTLASTVPIAASVPISGAGGAPQGSYTYRFQVESGPSRNMVWKPDGSEVYYWINLDDDATNASPPLQRTWLCNSSGKMGSPLISSDPDTQPNPFGYALSFADPVDGCTVGGHRGDIYANISPFGTAVPGDRIYRYDQTGTLKEIIPITYTHAVGHESDGIIGQAVKLVDGDLWLLCTRFPTTGFGLGHNHPALLKISGAAGHAMTVFHDWDGDPNGDAPVDVTYDTSGNVYVRVTSAASAYTPGDGGSGLWLVKYNSSGVQQWRRELDPGYSVAVGGFSWLTDDDETLLYDVARDANFFEVVKRYNVATDTMGSDAFAITTPLDTSVPFVNTVWSGGTAVLLPSGKMAIALGHGSSPTVDGSTVGWLSGDRRRYESGYKPSSNYDDEGMNIDADPDGVSIWVMSNNAASLYRFNISSGALTKTLTLRDELGNAYPTIPFCICGGFGGHGNPPPVVTRLRTPERISISWLN